MKYLVAPNGKPLNHKHLIESPVCNDSEIRFAIALLKQYSKNNDDTFWLYDQKVFALIYYYGGIFNSLKNKEIELKGLIREYPKDITNPRFFSEGFIFSLMSNGKFQLKRQFNFQRFDRALHDRVNTDQQGILNSFEYTYIKTACETRDSLIKNQEIHPIFRTIIRN